MLDEGESLKQRDTLKHLTLTDPSMTVRADIIGRYSNKMYAYETGDIKLCK